MTDFSGVLTDPLVIVVASFTHENFADWYSLKNYNHTHMQYMNTRTCALTVHGHTHTHLQHTQSILSHNFL